MEVEFESDLDFVDMWKAVYTDEYPVDAAAVESGDGEERSAKYSGTSMTSTTRTCRWRR